MDIYFSGRFAAKKKICEKPRHLYRLWKNAEVCSLKNSAVPINLRIFRRRDQLINLFPNKMLTWGRKNLLTFAISLVRHTDAEVCEETTMTWLIYRHSLKKKANYTGFLTQSWNKLASKNHSVTTVTSLVMAIGKEVINGENFTASIKYHSRPFVCVDA